MASDEEIARHVALIERDESTDAAADSQVREELDEYKAVAGEIHDELARRIQVVDDSAVDEDSLTAVVDRLDSLERRLDDLESKL